MRPRLGPTACLSLIAIFSACTPKSAMSSTPRLDAGGAAHAQDAGDLRRTPVQSASVFFFGHSLVDQDMPLMLGSMAAARHKTYFARGQLGWGTTLAAHVQWDGKIKGAPLGFPEENPGRSLFAGEGKEQLRTGKYDVVVITESNGHTRGAGDETKRDAETLLKLAYDSNKRARLFLYSVWLDRKEFPSLKAWQDRTAQDIRWWEAVADSVNEALPEAHVNVIPGGPILVEVTRAIERGELGKLRVDDLFLPGDGVHVNDLGFRVIALAQYAAIFRDTPVGLPREAETEDGPADMFDERDEQRVQQIVWDFLKAYPRSGIAP